MTAAVAAVSVLAGGSLLAGPGKQIIVEDPPEPWNYCDIFDYNKFYEGETGFIRGIEAHGRYHGQYISQSEDIGDTENGYNQWQHRRARLGLEVIMAHGLTFFMENNMADNEEIFADRWQNDFQDFYISWEASDDLEFVIGKQKQDFTIEDTTSSKRILTVERSPIVNETAGARPWGAVVAFKAGGFDNQLGAWLTGADDSWGSWPSFDSNASASFNTSYEIIDGTDLVFDYVYNDNSGGFAPVEGDADEQYASEYQHGFAIGTDSDWGKFDMVTNFIVAQNREGSGGLPDGHDTWGAMIMPSYYLTEKLQAVFRYAYMDEGREQRTQRFNTRVAVEDYHTFYGGLNYHFCGHNLKVMGGYEYATGNTFGDGVDIDTGTWLFAIRTYF